MEKNELINAVTRAQNGDSNAITELYNAFYNSVYYFAKKTVKDDDLALDITQETFMEVIKTIQSLKAPEAFSTWLRQITYHQCTRHFRKNKEVILDEDEEGNTILDNMADESEDALPEEVYEKAEFREIILSMIDNLTEEQRAVVVLYYYDELPVKKIAEIQGVSEGTVKSRLNYARKALRDGVETYEKKTGTKLHGIPFLPLFRIFFNEPAAMSAADVAVIGEAVSAAGVTVSATVAASAASTTAATASIAATAATTAAATIPLTVKIAAVLLAAFVTVGGGIAIAKNIGDSPTDFEEPNVEITETSDDHVAADVTVNDASDTEAPDTEVPDTEASDTEAPDTEVPDTEAPETEAPETEAPETETPETETLDTEAPETEAPETEAPETEAPDTEAPDTEAPDTEATETEAPDTETPDTEAPETEAPETEAPGTEAPETEAPETEASDTDNTDLPMGFACLTTHKKPTVTIQTVQHEEIDGIVVMPSVEMTITSNSYEFEEANAAGHRFSIYVDGKKLTLPVTMPNGETYAMSEFDARPSFTFTLSSWVWAPGTHEIKIVPVCMFLGASDGIHNVSVEDLTVTVIYDLTSPICPGCGGVAELHGNEFEHCYICQHCSFSYRNEAHTFVGGVCECGFHECGACGNGVTIWYDDLTHTYYCYFCDITAEPEEHAWSEWILTNEATGEYKRECFCGIYETTTDPQENTTDDTDTETSEA